MAAPEAGARQARARALAVLRVRGTALAVALVPAAAAVLLLVGSATDRIGADWAAARWAVTGVAVLVLLLAAGVAAVVVRARPAVSPTVPIAETSAPELYQLVRDLAEQLDVPAPSAVALTPDCDSWLEDRTHPAHGAGRTGPLRWLGSPGRTAPAVDGGPSDAAGRPTAVDADPGGTSVAGTGPEDRAPVAPVLVIGSPFLWWMRVGELRALLAPVVAGTGPSVHPDIAAARRFIRGLDAAVAVAAGRSTVAGESGPAGRSDRPGGVAAATPRALRAPALAFVGWVARLLLRRCREHAAEMERGVAAAAAERARSVDYGLRVAAQEQVGLAYAGWDRLLTRVALPAWRMGRWPSRLDAGVVSALTELSQRDRLADGLTSRLGDQPACELLVEPVAIDEATSLLAAHLFHGGPSIHGSAWLPVDWDEYADEVVDRKWRTDAARLHRALDEVVSPTDQPPAAGGSAVPADEPAATGRPAVSDADAAGGQRTPPRTDHGAEPARSAARYQAEPQPTTSVLARPAEEAARAAGRSRAEPPSDVRFGVRPVSQVASGESGTAVHRAGDPADPTGAAAPEPTLARVIDRLATGVAVEADGGEALASRLGVHLAQQEESAPPPAPPPGGPIDPWTEGVPPLFPLQPPRTGQELLADHVTAMVCCAAVDTAGARPGLDWLDGPALLVAGRRRADLAGPVLSLVEDGDAEPLRAWLGEIGVRSEKPVRLV